MATPVSCVRFGPFELDLRAGELRSKGQSSLLPDQVFQVLLILMEHDGDIATREEIKKRLWPNDTVVEFDHSINAAIKKLRAALDDSADAPRYIETVPRRGYRLMVPVESNANASPSESSTSPEGHATTKAREGHLAGKIVSHYRVLEIIGGGGMGVVYRAEDLKLGRQVALKFLPEELGSEPETLERFSREARAVSSLDHPNICSIYEFDEYEGYPFIVMQLLQGKTLREHLADGRLRLTQPETLEIAIQIASGLEAAHEKGIIHRDIKPANIFITEKNVAKILDFGVAKMASLSEPSPAVILSGDAEQHEGDESKEPYSNDGPGIEVLRLAAQPQGSSLSMTNEGEAVATPAKETTLTRTGVKLGTAGYMSPEQVRGEPLDARTDIFSFGLVIYEMATGERAFTGETEAILHDAIQHRDPKPVRELAPEISPVIEGVIERCLQKVPARRFQTAAAIRVALANAKNHAALVVSQEPEHAQANSRHRRRWVAATLTVVVVAAVAAGVLYSRAHPGFKLTDKDAVVLADFENKAGDPVFDGSLVWALRIGLEQTPFLNILSSDKVSRVLTQMGHNTQEPLTPELAREVCIKTNSTAALIGTIADAGNRYLIALRAVRCDTGKVIANSEATANERSQIVAELGQAAVDLRRKLGEPSATIRRFNNPLDHATSASVDTLKLYTEVLKRDHQEGPATAIADELQVTERDPSLAIAYGSLGEAYSNLGEESAMEDSYKKAFELRRQLTLRERLRIEGSYYTAVTGELEKAIGVWQEMKHEYPSYGLWALNLAHCFQEIGELENAATAARENIRLIPDSWHSYGHLISAEIAMNRWSAAKSVLEEAHSRKIDSDFLRADRLVIAFLERDREGMKKELEWEKSDPSAGGSKFLDEDKADAQLYFGHARVASTFVAQAVSKRLHAGFQESAAVDKCVFALEEAEIGETARAREDVTSALVMSPSSRDLQVCTSFVLARLGKGAEARRTALEIKREKPSATLVNGLQVPALMGAALLSEKKPAEALHALEPSIPYFRSEVDYARYTAYLRGISLLELKQGRGAIVEFRKLVDHPGLTNTNVIGSLARLQLARAQMMIGDRDAARNSYQDFLTLWKDADADIPIYKEAKAEYAKLQ